MLPSYTIGIDFGTQSVRTLLCRVQDGAVMGMGECDYAHGVMTASLPCGKPLPPHYALQDPQDYLDALKAAVSSAIVQSGISPQAIIGLGLDATCTMLPLGKDDRPLCTDTRFASHPHAWAKLWKHHGAEREAAELTALFEREDPEILASYGGRITSECFFAKLLEIMHEASEVFEATDRFIEMGDWLCQCLTGNEKRSLSLAVFKAFYRESIGYPPSLLAHDLRLQACVGSKLRGEFVAPGQAIGYLTHKAAQALHLPAGIAVAAPLFDSHAGLPAAGICDESAFLLSLGTSSSIIALHPKARTVKGLCSMAYQGIFPGYYAYAAGQSSFGDTLAWYTKNCVSAEIESATANNGYSIHQELTARAMVLHPGQSKLLALDWWNGSKPLLDTSLSGVMLGMTLQTRPEHIYLALLESLAYGVRGILEAFETAGIRPRSLHLAGGIASKNPFLVQLISDITRMPLLTTAPLATPAIGMAMSAATAAGAYATLFDAVSVMNCLCDTYSTPNEENSRAYDALYREYCTLSHYFTQENPVLHRLNALSKASR